MPGPMHKLHRAMEDLTLNIQAAIRDRDERNYELGMVEHEEQIQIPIGGPINGLGFQTFEVEFDSPFFYAPAQRDSDLERPHFSFGYETETDVVISCRVAAWTDKETNGATIGATVGVAVLSTSDVTFEGVLHLTFKGFAALEETEGDED